MPGKEEYLKIQYVDGNRIWFGQGCRLRPPTSRRRGTPRGRRGGAGRHADREDAEHDYTLAAATGTITEVTEFGAGNAVLVSYTSDFVMPPIYRAPLNDSPQVDEKYGDWASLPLESGTYTVGF